MVVFPVWIIWHFLLFPVFVPFSESGVHRFPLFASTASSFSFFRNIFIQAKSYNVVISSPGQPFSLTITRAASGAVVWSSDSSLVFASQYLEITNRLTPEPYLYALSFLQVLGVDVWFWLGWLLLLAVFLAVSLLKSIFLPLLVVFSLSSVFRFLLIHISLYQMFPFINVHSFGLGERDAQLRMAFDTPYVIFSQDVAPINSTLNQYGVHPFYLQMDPTSGGQAAGVLLWNAHSMEITLARRYVGFLDVRILNSCHTNLITLSCLDITVALSLSNTHAHSVSLADVYSVIFLCLFLDLVEHPVVP